MLLDLLKPYASQIASLQMLLLIISALLHIVFAGAVARDAGNLQAVNQKPVLVSGVAWAFATLVGGIFVAAIYWLLHHSTLTRR